MFNCYLHGWSSQEKPCPACHPVVIGTSTEINLDCEKHKECKHEYIYENSTGFVGYKCKWCGLEMFKKFY